jgi:hypothetical protein
MTNRIIHCTIHVAIHVIHAIIHVYWGTNVAQKAFYVKLGGVEGQSKNAFKAFGRQLCCRLKPKMYTSQSGKPTYLP